MQGLMLWASALTAGANPNVDELTLVEPEEWAEGAPEQGPSALALGPVLGLADLHLHLFGDRPEAAFGPAEVALATEHLGRTSPPGGLSSNPQQPHYLGWPTADATTGPQAWEGWLRLAHDGIPALWYLSRHPEFVDVHSGLQSFYDAYPDNLIAAANAGAVGVNLIVVSLSFDALACRERGPRTPAECHEMDALKRRYDAVVYWAAQQASWLDVVTTPAEAERTIQQGKLALVLSLEVADLFGPSELVVDGAPFAGGYWDYAKSLAGAGEPGEPEVRAALETYLEAFPKVTTLQLASQYDSLFAGASYTDANTVRRQRWRDSHGGAVAVDDERVRCQDAAASWKWKDDGGAPWPDCVAQGARTPGTPPSSASHRLPSTLRKASASIRPPGTSRYVNPYGLSVHGQWLIRLMLDRGMPVDLAAVSRAAFDEALATVDAHQQGLPVYVSHAYPDPIALLHRESHLSAEQLAALAAREGLVGVRTGPDPVKAAGEPGPFAEILQSHDCMGTSVVTGLYQQALFEAGVHTAYGTGLNSAGGQVGPTHQLRPPAWEQLPCTLAVPSVGSELSQRGLAHIGLLPQLQLSLMRVAAGPDGTQTLPDSVVDALSGANHYIDLWAEVWCASDAATGSYCDRRRDRPAREVWAGWEDWIGESDRLATVAVDLLEAGGTAPNRWGGNAAVVRGKPTGDVQAFDENLRRTTMVAGASLPTVDLPRLRALEGLLPYLAAQPDVARNVTPRPQLPTTVGLLIGAHSFTRLPDREDFPHETCIKSGQVEPVPYQRKWECRPIRDAGRRYRRAHAVRAFRSSLQAPYDQWGHTYPGQRAPQVHEVTAVGAVPPISFYALGRRILKPSGQATLWSQLDQVHTSLPRHSSRYDFPTFGPVVEFLTENRVCLSSGVLTAPPPGLPTGGAPTAWLERASTLAAKCYCAMLDHPGLDGQRRLADDEALTQCREEVLPLEEAAKAKPAKAKPPKKPKPPKQNKGDDRGR